jgi:ABC-type uncharacterized transport system substrate-binding protein
MKKFLFMALLAIVSLGLFNSCSKKQDSTKDGKKIYKIAIGYFGPDAGVDIVIKNFLDGMAALGYKEGDNLIITKFHAGGEMANIPQLFQKADNGGNDLIVAMTTPCIAGAATVVKKTKLIFVYVYDALAAGVGKTFQDHMPMLTGVQSFPPVEETISLIKESVPGITTLATVYNAGEANSKAVMEKARLIIQKNGITFKEFTVANTNDIAQSAIAAANSGAQAIWITGDNTVLQSFEGILKPANEKKIPVFINDTDFLERGAVAAIGIKWENIAKEAAKYADRVLKGENPKDMPIINITNTNIVVNKNILNKFNIKIPEKYMK